MRRVDPRLPGGVKGGGVPRAAASLAGYYLFVFHGFLRFKSTRAARDSRPHGAGREPGGAAGGGEGGPLGRGRARSRRAPLFRYAPLSCQHRVSRRAAYQRTAAAQPEPGNMLQATTRPDLTARN